MEWLIVWLTKVYLGWKYSEKNQSMVLLVILSQYSKWFSGDAVLCYVTSNEEKIIVLCTETRTSIINWKCRAQFFVIFQALITLPDAGNLWLCKLENFTFFWNYWLFGWQTYIWDENVLRNCFSPNDVVGNILKVMQCWYCAVVCNIKWRQNYCPLYRELFQKEKDSN